MMETAVVTLSICLTVVSVLFGLLTPLLLWRLLTLVQELTRLREKVTEQRVDLDKVDAALAQGLGLLHGEKQGGT